MRGLRKATALFRSHGLVVLAPVRQIAPALTAPHRATFDVCPQCPTRPSVRRYGTGKSRQSCSKDRKENDKQNKAGKQRSATGGSSEGSSDGRAKAKANPEEPFDMTDLEQAWARAAEKHEAVLKQLRTGGQFSPDVLGAIPVRPDRKSSETMPLRDLATVVPPKSGRRWSILCYDKDTKPAIKSAFQTSPKFNQQPQDSPDNELELVVTVELERTEDLERKVKETCNSWREAIRAGRSARDKVHKLWKATQVILKDDLTKLEKQVQTMQDAKMAEVKTKELESLRLLKAREK